MKNVELESIGPFQFTKLEILIKIYTSFTFLSISTCPVCEMKSLTLQLSGKLVD